MSLCNFVIKLYVLFTLNNPFETFCTLANFSNSFWEKLILPAL